MHPVQPQPINLSPGSTLLRLWKELAIVGLMIMELSIIVPWFRSMTPDTLAIPPLQVMVILGLVMAFAHACARLMNYLALKMRIRRGVFLVYFGLSVLFGLKYLLYDTERVELEDLFSRPFQAFMDWRTFIPAELIILLTVLFTTWRGLSLAQKYIEPASVKRDFQIGVLAVIGFVFINTIVTGETPGYFMYVFLCAGLFAMASSRIYSISQLRGGVKSPFDLKWFLGLSSSILFMISASSSVTWLISNRLTIIQGIGGLILGVFALVLLGISSPFIFLAQRLAENSQGLSRSVGELLESLKVFRDFMGGFAQRVFASRQVSRLFSLLSTLKPVLLWIFVIAMTILVLATIRRWMTRERLTVAGENESTFLNVDILALLRTALGKRIQRIRNYLSAASQIRSGRRWLVAARIRRIYAYLLDLAAALGSPRSEAQTPLEYLPSLLSLFPENRDNLIIITTAYLDVRYGEFPETEEVIKNVERAWRDIQNAGKLKRDQASHQTKGQPASDR